MAISDGSVILGSMGPNGNGRYLEETMSVLGVPFLAKKTFVQTEGDIGEWWQENA